MVKHKSKAKRVSKGTGVLALLLNILILPGLGSLIGKKTTAGIIQLVLVLIGFTFTLTLIGAILGVPLMIAAWIWALVTGIEILNEAK